MIAEFWLTDFFKIKLMQKEFTLRRCNSYKPGMLPTSRKEGEFILGIRSKVPAYAGHQQLKVLEKKTKHEASSKSLVHIQILN